MAMPSWRSMGSIRSDAMGPTSKRSRLRSQPRFSSSSMTPVPGAACCKQRHYGDRSPAFYTSIRSTTFASPLIHPESRKIATDARVVQNSRRLVISFFRIPQSQNGQGVEKEPLFVLKDRGDHMVLVVPSIVHDHEPDVVWRDS